MPAKDIEKIDYQTSPINLELKKEDKIELFKNIVGIRRFEERSLQPYNQGNVEFN